MDQDLEHLEGYRPDILKLLEKRSGFSTMPELHEELKGFDRSSDLARLLNHMMNEGLIQRRMGSKRATNNRMLYEYALVDANTSQPASNISQLILATSSASKADVATGLDYALKALKKRLNPIVIKDLDVKVKALNKLSDLMPNPLPGILKQIRQDLQANAQSAQLDLELTDALNEVKRRLSNTLIKEVEVKSRALAKLIEVVPDPVKVVLKEIRKDLLALHQVAAADEKKAA